MKEVLGLVTESGKSVIKASLMFLSKTQISQSAAPSSANSVLQQYNLQRATVPWKSVLGCRFPLSLKIGDYRCHVTKMQR